MKEESKEGFKRCSKCGRILPITDFYKRKRASDGLDYWCKQCNKANHAEWRAKNPTYDAEFYQANKEKIKAYNAEYYQAHKDKIAQRKAQYYAEYYDAHKDEILKKHAEYYQANKDEKKAYYDPILHPLNWARRMVNGYKKMDRNNGFGDKETISVDYFINHIANAECKYCHKRGYGLIGCNRIDNSKGHTQDNVEPCCMPCNSREGIRDQIARGLAWFQKGKKQAFKDFVNAHLMEKSKK